MKNCVLVSFTTACVAMAFGVALRAQTPQPESPDKMKMMETMKSDKSMTMMKEMMSDEQTMKMLMIRMAAKDMAMKLMQDPATQKMVTDMMKGKMIGVLTL
jgi:hypothetical protein